MKAKADMIDIDKLDHSSEEGDNDEYLEYI